MRRGVALSLLAAGYALAAAHEIQAENWAHWRGPAFNGSSPEKGLPSSFSKSENVLWVVPLPGPAAATPIIWEKRAFISSVDSNDKKLLAMCLDADSGKTLWSKEIASGINRDDRSNFASASPTTDGQLVYFYYGSGDLIAFDFSGKEIWKRNIQKEYGPYAFQWTFSSSPTLHDGRLYLQILQRNVPVNGRGKPDGPNESYLLALEPATGKEIWKHIRPADARQESLEAYSTPIPDVASGRDQLLIVGGDCITGHDSATGKELWRWGTWNPSKIPHWRMVVTPTAGAGVALACAPKGSPVYAVKTGSSGKLEDSDLAWVSKEREASSDVSTPLFYMGRFFILNSDRKLLSAVEPATGKVLWTGSLGSKAKLESSPTGADGKIYMMNHRGDVFITGAGDQFELLQTISMGEEGDADDRSTISVSGGRLFIRTASKLYCIGQK